MYLKSTQGKSVISRSNWHSPTVSTAYWLCAYKQGSVSRHRLKVSVQSQSSWHSLIVSTAYWMCASKQSSLYPHIRSLKVSVQSQRVVAILWLCQLSTDCVLLNRAVCIQTSAQGKYAISVNIVGTGVDSLPIYRNIRFTRTHAHSAMRLTNNWEYFVHRAIVNYIGFMLIRHSCI